MRLHSKRSNLAVAALGLALGGGCLNSTPAPPVQETTGELGNGVFRWDCVSSADPTCGTGVFPTAVAVGSRFELVFVGGNHLPDGLGVATLDPVSPTRLADTGVALEALRAGEVSVAAFGDGYAIDYLTLHLRPVDDLMLGEYESSYDEPCDDFDFDDVCDGTGGVVADPPVSLVVGEVTRVRARPFGGGRDLAGALDYTWTSLTPDLLDVGDPTGRGARLTPLGVGVVRLSVRAGDFVEVFEYEVQDSPPEPGDTGDESEGSGTGTGSETGTGTDSGSDSGTASGSGSESESGTTGTESGTDTGSASGTSGETDGATTTGGMR